MMMMMIMKERCAAGWSRGCTTGNGSSVVTRISFTTTSDGREQRVVDHCHSARVVAESSTCSAHSPFDSVDHIVQLGDSECTVYDIRVPLLKAGTVVREDLPKHLSDISRMNG